MALAGVLVHKHFTRFHESQSHYTERAIDFVNEINQRVRAEQKLWVLVRGKHPLTTLLGRHPGSYLSRRDFTGPVYVVMPVTKKLTALVVSEPLPVGFDDIENRPVEQLGLYFFPAGGVPVEMLVEQQKLIGSWTRTENPYYSPGTVYRDE